MRKKVTVVKGGHIIESVSQNRCEHKELKKRVVEIFGNPVSWYECKICPATFDVVKHKKSAL